MREIWKYFAKIGLVSTFLVLRRFRAYPEQNLAAVLASAGRPVHPMAEAHYVKLEAQSFPLTARVPIISWLSSYEAKYFLTDLTAGVSLGTMCLAQTMAHATIATTEPIQGEKSFVGSRNLSFKKVFSWVFYLSAGS